MSNGKSDSRVAKTGRIIWLTVNVVMALCVVVSAYGGAVPPTVSVTAALAAMAFPALLAAWGLLAVVNVVVWRRLLWLNLAVTALCAGPVLTFCPLNLFRPSVARLEADSTMVKVMTFNVWRFHDMSGEAEIHAPTASTVDYIVAEDADIVMLQEAAPLSPRCLEKMADSLRSRLTDHYPYSYVHPHGGMGLLSKYPFDHNVLEKMEGYPSFDADYFKVTLADGGELHLIDLHLESLRLSDDEKRQYVRMVDGEAGVRDSTSRSMFGKLESAFIGREFQARYVRAYIDSVVPADAPLIVAGDFNDVAGCYAERVIQSDDMTDVYRAAGLGPAVTYHAYRFYFRIDHMLCRGPVSPRRAYIGDCGSSDHYPLVCLFTR